MSVKTLNMKSTTQRTNAQKLIKSQEELHKNTVEQIEQKQHTHMHIYIYIIIYIYLEDLGTNKQHPQTQNWNITCHQDTSPNSEPRSHQLQHKPLHHTWAFRRRAEDILK